MGLAAEHIYYNIADKEGFHHSFFSLNDPTLGCDCTAKKASLAEEIPLYFMNKLPHGFFAQLVKEEKKGALNIDYASLASILTSAYTLEEDDLHKGNFGFYLVERKGKPQVVFFKIDHDLMFADAIMSFYSIRPQHVFNDQHSFDIKAEDLLDFPNLSYSANAYWPTKKSVLANPWNEKEYHCDEEVEAFANLSQVAAFKKAKWLSFYKHILIPPKLNELILEQSLDKNKERDRAQIALIAQAISARQASLRAMLFSLKEFHHFVQELSEEEKYSLVNEIVDFCPAPYKKTITNKLRRSLSFYEHLCPANSREHRAGLYRPVPKDLSTVSTKQFSSALDFKRSIEEGDTPLHTAIKLGDFRYEESLGMFGHLINKKNKAGKTPLDCAFEMSSEEDLHPQDVRKDLLLTMKYLLKYGAIESDEFKLFNSKEHIENYQFQTQYINRAKQIDNYEALKELLRDIGEDHSYCLKFKKKIVVECIKQFIVSHKNHLNLAVLLTQLKKEISDEVPELKYIRQLRSSLWIIRQIRGLYGWTTTQGELNTLINQTLADVKPQHSLHSFFNKRQFGASEYNDSYDAFCSL